MLGRLAVVLAIIAGAIAGATWAWIAAELKRRFHVLEIISTIMLNFIAIHLVSFLVRGPLQEPTRIYPQTETFIRSARLPVLVPGLAWAFKRTAFGFRVRATGASPSAAKVAGLIDTEKTSLIVFLVSGALAGIAGSVEVSGVTFALYENLSPGYGYTAIAVALIAGLNPVGIIASGIFFGILETGASALQREFAIPSSLASVVEATLIIAALTIAAVRGRHTLIQPVKS
jgi:simple sugar transport system permease protein